MKTYFQGLIRRIVLQNQNSSTVTQSSGRIDRDDTQSTSSFGDSSSIISSSSEVHSFSPSMVDSPKSASSGSSGSARIRCENALAMLGLDICVTTHLLYRNELLLEMVSRVIKCDIRARFRKLSSDNLMLSDKPLIFAVFINLQQ